MYNSTQTIKRNIELTSVIIFFLSMLLAATVYTYLLIELFGKSEFASMSSTNASGILIFGAASTVAFVVWKLFPNCNAKTILLFGTIFQSVIMIGVITINNFIAIYPIISIHFQALYWIGWVVGIAIQPVVALGVVLSVKNKFI